MNMSDYQKESQKTSVNHSTRLFDADNVKLLNACLGLSGEVGEFVDYVKKSVFQNHDIDFDHLVLELGDILWYVAQAAESLYVSLDDVATINLDKLAKRYKGGVFSTKESIKR